MKLFNEEKNHLGNCFNLFVHRVVRQIPSYSVILSTKRKKPSACIAN